jgi:hypothetical protein
VWSSGFVVKLHAPSVVVVTSATLAKAVSRHRFAAIVTFSPARPEETLPESTVEPPYLTVFG